jgi:iron complex outermembrane receptor protein
MKSISLRMVSAVLLLTAFPLLAAPSASTLEQYLAAQRALAAGDVAASRTALHAIASGDDRTLRAALAPIPANASIADMRRAFKPVAEAAAQWDLPAGMIIAFCPDPSAGGMWVQREGPIENPFGASNCGSPLVREAMTIHGYLNTYSVGESESATRLNASLLEIPLSVKPLTRDLMNDRNVASNVNEVFKNEPAVTPEEGYLRPNYYLMRGFFGLNYRDGVREPIDGTISINPFELDKIEVLKGPSSILYGKGDPGGVINFMSKRPASAFSGQGLINAGSFGMKRGDFDITGAFTPNIDGRLIASYEDSDSYRDVVTSKRVYVTPSVTFAITPKTNLWLTGEWASNDSVPDQGVFLRPGGVVPPLSTREFYYGGPDDRSKIKSQRMQGQLETSISDTWLFRAVIGTQRNKQNQLDRVYSFIDSGPTGYLGLLPPNQLYQLRFTETADRDHVTGRVESHFTFASGMTKHQLLVGADYRDETETIPQNLVDYGLFDYTTNTHAFSIFGLPFGAGLFYDQHTNVKATGTDLGVAAQDLIEIGSNVSILAGIRFEHDTINSDRTGVQTISKVLGGQPVSLDAHPDEATSDNVAPRFGIVYRFSPETSVYGSYLTSFISPVPGLLTQAGNPLKPENAGQWEFGVKRAIVPQRLMATAAIYEITKHDAFVFYPLYAENAGTERSRGAELDLTGAVTPELNLTAGYSYVDMKFVDGDPALVGKTREGVPSNQYNLWATYNPIALHGLTFGAGLTHTSSVWGNYPNTAKLPGYTLIDAMAGYQFGAWRAQLNLFNIGSSEGYWPTAGFSGGKDPNLDPLTALPIPPRRFTLNLSYLF